MDPLLSAAQETLESQRDVARLADPLAAVDDPIPLLRAASDHHLDRAFTTLLFAALHLGRTVPAELLVDGARLLPSPDALAAVAGRLQGDVGSALVAAVRRRGLDD